MTQNFAKQDFNCSNAQNYIELIKDSPSAGENNQSSSFSPWQGPPLNDTLSQSGKRKILLTEEGENCITGNTTPRRDRVVRSARQCPARRE